MMMDSANLSTLSSFSVRPNKLEGCLMFDCFQYDSEGNAGPWGWIVIGGVKVGDYQFFTHPEQPLLDVFMY